MTKHVKYLLDIFQVCMFDGVAKIFFSDIEEFEFPFSATSVSFNFFTTRLILLM